MIFFNATIMKRLGTILIASLFLLPYTSQAQGFNASILAGFTASQIDGDNLAGFDKLGLVGGLRVTRNINDRYYGGLEFLFDQRGSQSEITLGTPSDQSRTHLDYIEIPFIFGIQDWFIEEEGYYKVRAELGISYGYLVNASSTNSQFVEDIENFRSSILSYHLGVGYQINSRWAGSARYTRDFTNLLESGLKSYFWSLRLEFSL